MIDPRYLYPTFLLMKALMNIGAGITAITVLGDWKIGGFWLALGIADGWFGVWSIQ